MTNATYASPESNAITDVMGSRLKVGVVVPSTNSTVQPEIDNIRVPGVTLHTGRIPTVQKDISGDKGFLDHMALMRSGIKDAMDTVLSCGPHHVIMSVALEAFWGGAKGADELQEDLEQHANRGITLGSNAVRDALKAFGVKSIAYLSPHPPAGNEHILQYFRESGFSVENHAGLSCKSPFHIAQVPKSKIREELLALDSDNVDALVQLGTALGGASVCVELEKTLGKPVIQINVATFWDALRRNGINDKVSGVGRIFEAH